MTAKVPYAKNKSDAAKYGWSLRKKAAAKISGKPIQKKKMASKRSDNHRGPIRVVRCANCPKYERCDECRIKHNNRQREKVSYRRANGLCTWCGQPNEDGKTYCNKHLAQRNKWLQERRRKQLNVSVLKPLRKAGKQDEQKQSLTG